MIFVTAVLVTFLFHQSQAQTCKCTILNLPITWNSIGDCRPIPGNNSCTGTQTREGYCSVMFHPVSCNLNSHPCNLTTRTCSSSWSKWSPIGPCSASCGSGIQPSSRQCYYKYRPGNVRSRDCAGSNGVSEQARKESCQSFLFCNRPAAVTTKIPALLHTTTPANGISLVTTAETTAKSPRSFSGNVSTNSTGSAVGPTDSNRTKTPQEPRIPNTTTTRLSTVNITLLAAVLGSLAILGIVVIVIILVVHQRKPVSPSTATSRLPTSSDRMFREVHGSDTSYEMVGPPPVPTTIRPSQLGNQPEANSLVINTLYEPAFDEQEKPHYLKSDVPTTACEDYLQPLNSSRSQDVPEAVYFVIDGPK